MTVGKETFGACIRRERESRRLGLRQMAKKIGVSPTYLSKVERDEFTPPTEEKVRAIARFIERDPDQLLAMAGRVSSDILDIIKRHPMELPTFLRSLTDEDVVRLTQYAQEVLEAMKVHGRPNRIKDGR